MLASLLDLTANGAWNEYWYYEYIPHCLFHIISTGLQLIEKFELLSTLIFLATSTKRRLHRSNKSKISSTRKIGIYSVFFVVIVIVTWLKQFLMPFCQVLFRKASLSSYFSLSIAKKIGKQIENSAVLSNDSSEVVRHLHENRLIDLAFDWDYIDGVTPILQRWLDEMINKKSHQIEVNS
jgi:hypothetical protein